MRTFDEKKERFSNYQRKTKNHAMYYP